MCISQIRGLYFNNCIILVGGETVQKGHAYVMEMNFINNISQILGEPAQLGIRK